MDRIFTIDIKELIIITINNIKFFCRNLEGLVGEDKSKEKNRLFPR